MNLAAIPMGWGFAPASVQTGAHPTGEQLGIEAGITLATMQRRGERVDRDAILEAFPEINRATAYRWQSLMEGRGGYVNKLLSAGLVLEQWCTELQRLPTVSELRLRFGVSLSTAFRWRACARATFDILNRDIA